MQANKAAILKRKVFSCVSTKPITWDELISKKLLSSLPTIEVGIALRELIAVGDVADLGNARYSRQVPYNTNRY